MRDALANPLRKYVELVRERATGDGKNLNHESTRASLIGPLFSLLGWDLNDPDQCIPEWRPKFGHLRWNNSIDWAFFRRKAGNAIIGDDPIFVVEVKRRKDELHRHTVQLADYFHKAKVRLGILSNGVEWWFFTDLQRTDTMDTEPFMKWGVLDERQPPVIELLRLLTENTYDAKKVVQFAHHYKKVEPYLREARATDLPSEDCKRTAKIVNKPDNRKFPGEGVPIAVMARLSGVSRVTIQDRCLILLLETEVRDALDAGARGEDGLSMRQVMDGGFFHAGTGTGGIRAPKTRREQLALIAKLKGTRGLGALREADLAAERPVKKKGKK